jgi:hypothetical protein
MAPRGSDIDPDVPDMGYTINDKAEVWSDNVLNLYEEAVSRQMSATRDIPWSELPELDPDLEHANVPAVHGAVGSRDGRGRLPGEVAVSSSSS